MTLIAKLAEEDHPRRRRRRLRSMAFAPTLMTLGNLTCGFAAIHMAVRAMYDFGAGVTDQPLMVMNRALLERTLPSFVSVGAGLVILGMVFDLFDGLLARVTRSTTHFGGQLDSLADVVTFGVAPATLMVTVMTKELARDAILPSPLSEHLMGRIAWVCAAVYVAFAAMRLARYNVEHAEEDFDYRMFQGMPSPAAACVMVALILFHDQVHDQIGATAQRALVYAMPVIALAIGCLMISRVPYRRFHRAYFLGRKPVSHVITCVLILAVFLTLKTPTLLLIVLWYAVSGPAFLAIRRLRERRHPVAAPGGAESVSDERRHA